MYEAIKMQKNIIQNLLQNAASIIWSGSDSVVLHSLFHFFESRKNFGLHQVMQQRNLELKQKYASNKNLENHATTLEIWEPYTSWVEKCAAKTIIQAQNVVCLKIFQKGVVED